MQIRRVRDEKTALRRFVEEGWMPYHDALSETVGSHSLVGDLDTESVVEQHLDQLDSPANRLWVALEDVDDDPTTPLATIDATFAGFVQTRLNSSPQEFDSPDRLTISDLWIRESFRGSGLADDLIERTMQQAREDGCTELTLKLGTDNERAIAYFDDLGFEVQGFRMHVPLRDVTLEVSTDEPMTGTHSSVLLRRFQVTEEVMSRFVEECWFPFWRDLGAAVGEQYISPNVDRDALVERFLEDYDVPDRRCWAALDDIEDATVPLDETDAIFAGWLNAGLEPHDRFLDPPDRLFIGNLYVKPDYRGSGLADHLILRAIQYAQEEGCGELSLGVDAANERAMAYYEKLGFEPQRQTMAVPLDAVEL